jgi:16S rRNA (guanine527-N7)-methyltransferase
MSEPVEPTPAVAAEIFGPRLALAHRYAGLLATEATVRGLIGPREVPRLWERHLLNCAVVAELIDRSAEVVDVGSGAGLPGIPLAIARPDLTVTLVEPLLRRSTWLADIIDRLELGNVTVRRARAEDLHGQLHAAYVTARAVAPLSRLATWCLPLLQPGGVLLAMKGRSADGELADAEDVIRALGGVDWRVCRAGSSTLSDPTSVVQVRVGSSAPRSQPASPDPGRSRAVPSSGTTGLQTTERRGGGR